LLRICPSAGGDGRQQSRVGDQPENMYLAPVDQLQAISRNMAFIERPKDYEDFSLGIGGI
jgi:hypothetical protein